MTKRVHRIRIASHTEMKIKGENIKIPLNISKRNHDLISDKKCILQQFFYKNTIKSSETLVKRKFPLQ